MKYALIIGFLISSAAFAGEYVQRVPEITTWEQYQQQTPREQSLRLQIKKLESQIIELRVQNDSSRKTLKDTFDFIIQKWRESYVLVAKDPNNPLLKSREETLRHLIWDLYQYDVNQLLR